MNILLTSSFSGQNKKLRENINNTIDTENAKVLVFPSCVTGLYDYDIELVKNSVADDLICIGFKYKNISIFNYCEEYNKNKVDISDYDCIFIPGGNTFVLRFLTSKYFEQIKKAAYNGKLIITESAGSILLTEDISIAGFADKNPVLETETSGIGLVDFYIKPHFATWLKYKKYFEDFSEIMHKKIICLWDSSFIVVKDDQYSVFGKHIVIGEKYD